MSCNGAAQPEISVMQAQHHSKTTEFASAMEGAYPEAPSSRDIYLTVRQFSQRNPAFTEPSVRNLIFKSDPRESSLGTIPGNGLIEAGAIVRIGRKVLISEKRFFAWVEGVSVATDKNKKQLTALNREERASKDAQAD